MLVGPQGIAQHAMVLRWHCSVLYSNDIYVFILLFPLTMLIVGASFSTIKRYVYIDIIRIQYWAVPS
jgi:hypothetical protein